MKRIIIITCLLIFVGLVSCTKYLEYPSDKKLSVITKLDDLQALLDQYYTVNHTDPCMGEPASDNVHMDDDSWQSIDEYERSLYVWNPLNVVWPFSHYGSGNGWSLSYDIVYKANTVLENLNKFEENPDEAYNNVKGQAHFLRGKSFLQVAWIWSLAYDTNTAKKELGIPLRLSSDFNEVSVRSSIHDTYQQIIDDLTMAASLLPETSIHPYRTNKSAAYGYLARTFLSMRDYDRAERYADSSLMITDKLIDLNSDIDVEKNFPFTALNDEVIYVSKMGISMGLFLSKIDSTLYRSYSDNDLRKVAYFKLNEDGSHSFRGSYDGSSRPFTGVTTSEIYLISMECKARNGSNQKAVDMLNHLLSKRFLKSTYVPIESDGNILPIVLNERRKELVFRDIRWSDIKRLNKENAGIVLNRSLNGKEYLLLPNDLRYAMALPQDLVEREGIQQNPR